MQGIPVVLNTKEDIENLLLLTNDGKINKNDLKNKLSSLLDDEYILEFSKEVEEDYQEQEGERKRPEFDNETSPPSLLRWCLDIPVRNKNSIISRLGMTESEIKEMILHLT